MAGNKHDNGVHEQGTDETRMAYQEDTPGQSVEKYIEDRNKAYHEEAVEKKKKHFSQVFQNPLKGFPYNEEIQVDEISENYVEEGTMAIGIKDRDPKERAKAQAQLKVMLKKIGNKKVGSKEGQDFDDKLDYDILSDDILADEFANPKNKNMKVKDLLKKHSKRLNVNFDESVEERYADRLKDKTKSQQKAHQKSMIKIARKSIKDYEKRNQKRVVYQLVF